MLAGALSACASSSGPTPDSRTRADRSGIGEGGFGGIEIFTAPGVGERTIEARAVDVWGVLPSVYEDLEIPITLSDPGSMHVGNNGYRARRIEGARMSKYFHCGRSMTGLLADEHSITVTISTQLKALPGGEMTILTTVSAMARPRATGGQPFPCESAGVLEMRVAQLAVEKLAIGGGIE